MTHTEGNVRDRLLRTVLQLEVEEPGEVLQDILRIAGERHVDDLSYRQLEAAQRLVDHMPGRGT